MFIIRSDWNFSWGGTIEQAIDRFEKDIGSIFDPEEHTIYEAKEIKVQRKFVVIEEQL